MARMKKLFLVFTLISLLFVCTAASAATVKQDGLEITMTTDKDSYVAGDEVIVTLTVKNTGSATVKGADVRFDLPDGCVSESGASEQTLSVSMLASGEKQTLTTKFVVGAGADTPSVPNTGDGSHPALWFALLALSVFALSRMSRKARRSMMALVLCTAIACGMVLYSADVVCAEEIGMTINIDDNDQTASQPIIIVDEAESEADLKRREIEEAVYQEVLSKAGTQPAARTPVETRTAVVTETVTVLGNPVALSASVEYTNPSESTLSAAYVYDTFKNKALTQTLSSTTTVYNKTLLPGVVLPESAHTYSTNLDELYIINGPVGTTSVTLTFSSSTQFENNFDALLVYDGSGNYVGYYTGTSLANKTITVPGTRAYLRLFTDYSVVKYGFAVTSAVAHTSPKFDTIANTKNGHISMTWKIPYGYKGYAIQRANVSSSGTTGSYSTIHSNLAKRETSYVDTSATDGSLYSYRLLLYVSTSDFDIGAGTRVVRLNGTTITSGTANTSSSTPKITLKWNAVPYATRYQVFRSTTQNGTYTNVGYATSTSFTDTPPSKSQYFYRVRPCVVNNGTLYPGAFSDPYFCGYAVKPTGLTGYSNSDMNVHLSWNATTNASGYEIFRSMTNKAASYFKCAETTSTSADVTIGQKHVTNYYRVRAYYTVDGQRQYSNFSAPFAIHPLSKPSVTSHTQSGNSHTIRWGAVANAQKYTVLYGSTWNGTYQTYGTTTSNQITLTGLPTTWTNMYVRICAQRTDGSVTSRSIYSTPYRIYTNLRAPENAKAYGYSAAKVTLNWDLAPQAAGYEIFSSTTNAAGSYVMRAESTIDEETVIVPKTGGMNYFRIRSYIVVGGKRVYSPFGPVISAFPLAKPTGLTGSINSSNVPTVSWNTVANAQRYAVYYSSTRYGTYTRYTTTTSRSITMSNLPSSMTTIYIKVAAERVDGSVISRSFACDPIYLQKDTSTFRALNVFIETSNNCDPMYVDSGDLQRFRSIFNYASPYGLELSSSNTYTRYNLSKASLRSEIGYMANRADSNDVTFFYLACHGMNSVTTGVNAGRLALRGSDRMTFQELATELKKIPGKVVIVLASCGSGSAIQASEGGAGTEKFDPDAFTQEFIDVFAENDEYVPGFEGDISSATGELRVPNKFYVVTSCKPGMSGYFYNHGYTILIDWLYRAVCYTVDGTHMAADTSGNNIVTLAELYTYLTKKGKAGITASNGTFYMYPQVYPTASTFPIFQVN